MSAYAEFDKNTLRQRWKALNAPSRIIARAYSSVVLHLHQMGMSGPLARKRAIQQTAAMVSKITGVPVSPAEVESALAGGGYIRG